MAENILDRSIQSILDECTQILEDTRTLGSEDKWNDPLFSLDQEWVANLDPDSTRAVYLKLSDLEQTLIAREDCTKFRLLELVELLEGGGHELIAQMQWEDYNRHYRYLLTPLGTAQRLTQDTVDAEGLLLKDTKEHVQSEYRRILLSSWKNYARLEEVYHESRSLLHSLEVLRSQALEEEREEA